MRTLGDTNTFDIVIPLRIDLTVGLPIGAPKFEVTGGVRLRAEARAQEPLLVVIDIDEAVIDVQVQPMSRLGKALRTLAGLDAQIQTFIADYVREKIAGAQAARVINVAERLGLGPDSDTLTGRGSDTSAGEPTAEAGVDEFGPAAGYPTGDALAYPSADDMELANFRERIGQLDLTALSPKAIYKAAYKKVKVDGVTDFVDGRVARFNIDEGQFSGFKDAEVSHAQQHVADTLDSAFLISGDIANLRGLNQVCGRTDANFHYSNLAAIFRAALEETAAVVVPWRAGGDEICAVVVGDLDDGTIATAVATIGTRAREYARQHHLSDIAHPKHPGEPEYSGVGLHVGYAEILPGLKLEDICNDADLGVERSKTRSMYVTGEPGRAPGADGTDSGAAATAHRGAGTRSGTQAAGGEGEAAGRAGAKAEAGHPLNGRSRYMQPEGRKRASFMTEAARICGLAPADARKALDELYEPLATDGVTGYKDGRDGESMEAELTRARKWLADTGEPGFFVSTHLVNLTGLNQHAQNRAEVANAHYRAVAEIQRTEFKATGARVDSFRTGPDRMAHIVVGTIDAATMAAAEAAINARIDSYTRREGLAEIKNPSNLELPGVRLRIGYTDIATHDDVDGILRAVDARGGLPRVSVGEWLAGAQARVAGEVGAARWYAPEAVVGKAAEDLLVAPRVPEGVTVSDLLCGVNELLYAAAALADTGRCPIEPPPAETVAMVAVMGLHPREFAQYGGSQWTRITPVRAGERVCNGDDEARLAVLSVAARDGDRRTKFVEFGDNGQLVVKDHTLTVTAQGGELLVHELVPVRIDDRDIMRSREYRGEVGWARLRELEARGVDSSALIYLRDGTAEHELAIGAVPSDEHAPKTRIGRRDDSPEDREPGTEREQARGEVKWAQNAIRLTVNALVEWVGSLPTDARGTVSIVVEEAVLSREALLKQVVREEVRQAAMGVGVVRFALGTVLLEAYLTASATKCVNDERLTDLVTEEWQAPVRDPIGELRTNYRLAEESVAREETGIVGLLARAGVEPLLATDGKDRQSALMSEVQRLLRRGLVWNDRGWAVALVEASARLKAAQQRVDWLARALREAHGDQRLMVGSQSIVGGMNRRSDAELPLDVALARHAVMRLAPTWRRQLMEQTSTDLAGLHERAFTAEAFVTRRRDYAVALLAWFNDLVVDERLPDELRERVAAEANPAIPPWIRDINRFQLAVVRELGELLIDKVGIRDAARTLAVRDKLTETVANLNTPLDERRIAQAMLQSLPDYPTELTHLHDIDTHTGEAVVIRGHPIAQKLVLVLMPQHEPRTMDPLGDAQALAEQLYNTVRHLHRELDDRPGEPDVAVQLWMRGRPESGLRERGLWLAGDIAAQNAVYRSSRGPGAPARRIDIVTFWHGSLLAEEALRSLDAAAEGVQVYAFLSSGDADAPTPDGAVRLRAPGATNDWAPAIRIIAELALDHDIGAIDPQRWDGPGLGQQPVSESESRLGGELSSGIDARYEELTDLETLMVVAESMVFAAERLIRSWLGRLSIPVDPEPLLMVGEGEEHETYLTRVVEHLAERGNLIAAMANLSSEDDRLVVRIQFFAGFYKEQVDYERVMRKEIAPLRALFSKDSQVLQRMQWACAREAYAATLREQEDLVADLVELAGRLGKPPPGQQLGADDLVATARELMHAVYEQESDSIEAFAHASEICIGIELIVQARTYFERVLRVTASTPASGIGPQQWAEMTDPLDRAQAAVAELIDADGAPAKVYGLQDPPSAAVAYVRQIWGERISARHEAVQRAASDWFAAINRYLVHREQGDQSEQMEADVAAIDAEQRLRLIPEDIVVCAWLPADQVQVPDEPAGVMHLKGYLVGEILDTSVGIASVIDSYRGNGGALVFVRLPAGSPVVGFEQDGHGVLAAARDLDVLKTRTAGMDDSRPHCVSLCVFGSASHPGNAVGAGSRVSVGEWLAGAQARVAGEVGAARWYAPEAVVGKAAEDLLVAPRVPEGVTVSDLLCGVNELLYAAAALADTGRCPIEPPPAETVAMVAVMGLHPREFAQYGGSQWTRITPVRAGERVCNGDDEARLAVLSVAARDGDRRTKFVEFGDNGQLVVKDHTLTVTAQGGELLVHELVPVRIDDRDIMRSREYRGEVGWARLRELEARGVDSSALIYLRDGTAEHELAIGAVPSDEHAPKTRIGRRDDSPGNHDTDELPEWVGTDAAENQQSRSGFDIQRVLVSWALDLRNPREPTEKLVTVLDDAHQAVLRAGENVALMARLCGDAENGRALIDALIKDDPYSIAHAWGFGREVSHEANRKYWQRKLADGDQLRAGDVRGARHGVVHRVDRLDARRRELLDVRRRELEAAAKRAGATLWWRAFDPTAFGGEGRAIIELVAHRDQLGTETPWYFAKLRIDDLDEDLIGAALHELLPQGGRALVWIGTHTGALYSDLAAFRVEQRGLAAIGQAEPLTAIRVRLLGSPPISVAERDNPLGVPADAGPRVIAHKGGPVKRPENTAAADEQALRDGADGVESDFYALGEKGPAVRTHDPLLNRTSDGAGFVTARSLDELRRLDFGARHSSRKLGDAQGDTGIQTFDELVKWHEEWVRHHGRPLTILAEAKHASILPVNYNVERELVAVSPAPRLGQPRTRGSAPGGGDFVLSEGLGAGARTRTAVAHRAVGAAAGPRAAGVGVGFPPSGRGRRRQRDRSLHCDVACLPRTR